MLALSVKRSEAEKNVRALSQATEVANLGGLAWICPTMLRAPVPVFFCSEHTCAYILWRARGARYGAKKPGTSCRTPKRYDSQCPKR